MTATLLATTVMAADAATMATDAKKMAANARAMATEAATMAADAGALAAEAQSKAAKTVAISEDPGVELKISGQATVYYQSSEKFVLNATDNGEIFNQPNSAANAGVQLNIDADLKNNFSFGSQITALGTLGLENSLVNGVMQTADGELSGGSITKLYIAKRIGNTKVKAGRQELPKILSPLAFSENWNVYKNTFDATLLINGDIPSTILVGAYVDAANTHANLGQFDKLSGGAYMLTAQTTAIPVSTLTASYYNIVKGHGAGRTIGDAAGTTLPHVNGIWADVAVAGEALPNGFKFGLQGGSLSVDAPNTDDTIAVGVKVGVEPSESVRMSLAYSSVNDGTLNMQNVATGIKTPLYTQLLENQDAIKRDSDTLMVRVAYTLGYSHKIIVQSSMTTAGKTNIYGSNNDSTNLELLYTYKADGIDLLAAFVNITDSNSDSKNIARLTARYNFQ